MFDAILPSLTLDITDLLDDSKCFFLFIFIIHFLLWIVPYWSQSEKKLSLYIPSSKGMQYLSVCSRMGVCTML